MLRICHCLGQLRIGQLMEVYAESVAQSGAEHDPDLPQYEQVFRAEQDFYAYLSSGFFNMEGDLYCIWEEDGIYIAALRLQRYQDGLLLEALETHPDYRCQGYAERLIRAVLDEFGAEKIYSHIGHRNAASQAVHSKCGFHKIKNYARYADGSVNSYCGTYLYDAKNAGD